MLHDAARTGPFVSISRDAQNRITPVNQCVTFVAQQSAGTVLPAAAWLEWVEGVGEETYESFIIREPPARSCQRETMVGWLLLLLLLFFSHWLMPECSRISKSHQWLLGIFPPDTLQGSLCAWRRQWGMWQVGTTSSRNVIDRRDGLRLKGTIMNQSPTSQSNELTAVYQYSESCSGPSISYWSCINQMVRRTGPK